MVSNKILVILGMHRSGTSLITRWLHNCGLAIGDALLGPETGNDEGHFEDLDFIHLHERILISKKIPHTGLTFKTPGKLVSTQFAEIKNLIEAKNKKNNQWAWKDPRTCLFLNSYRKLLPGATYLIIFRDYQAVVSSLLNRDYKGLQRYYQSKGMVYKFFLRMKRKYHKNWLYNRYAEKYLKIWIAYNEELLKHIEALPSSQVMVVGYESLLKDDKPFFNRLTMDGFTLQYQNFKSIFNTRLINQPVDISPFIKNNYLLAKAMQLQTTIQNILLRQGY
ncbi:MAG TPA: sulfotransferase [Chitinophagaceae bacterium]|nr:sulfotransferase [Chitinophagaceae bacterium]